MCWQRSEETGNLVHCRQECKLMQLLWKTVWWFHKKLNRITIWLSNSTPSYLPRIKNGNLNKTLYTHVHGSIIPSSQKVETTQVSINRWMDTQNVVYPSYNGILFVHEKEWSSDTWYLMILCYLKEASHERANTVWFYLHKMSIIGKFWRKRK